MATAKQDNPNEYTYCVECGKSRKLPERCDCGQPRH